MNFWTFIFGWLWMIFREHVKLKSIPIQEGDAAVAVAEEVKKNNHVVRKLEKRQQICTLDQHIEEQFGGGRLLACIIAWVRSSA
ncbi:unnamed protein product [Prunus armeniaca]